MPKFSLMVRSLPYPALEDGNFSFFDGSYTASTKLLGTSGTKVILEHQLSGAPLIEKLIEKGDAKYACLVSVPKTGYRKLHIADSNRQEIGWELDIVGEPPMLRPVVLYVAKGLSRKLTKSDGVAPIWQGKKVDIPKGARLASGRYLRPSSSIQSLLRVRHSKDMDSGSFLIEQNSNEGFYFSMEAASDIYRFIQNPQDNIELKNSIFTHALSQCLVILKSEYNMGEDDEDKDDSANHWKQHSNLVAFAEWLKTSGMPCWFEDGFDTVLVATKLYPIELPAIIEDE